MKTDSISRSGIILTGHWISVSLHMWGIALEKLQADIRMSW
jgi:hypothetical protein